MSTSVTMPRLGESVTEGTVTRWLKSEGDQVQADEPLLEVSTDKVDTEVPSPASGTLLSIKVQEDETVEIGVELAVIGEEGESGGQAQDEGEGEGEGEGEAEGAQEEQAEAEAEGEQAERSEAEEEPERDEDAERTAEAAVPESKSEPEEKAEPESKSEPEEKAEPAPKAEPPARAPAPPQAPPRQAPSRPSAAEQDDEVAGTYVTPLVRKLASEHGVDLNAVQGTGVGGRIRKSDVLGAAEAAAAKAAESAKAPAATAAPSAPAAAAGPSPAAAAAKRGRVEPMSRMRQVIAARMVESLQTSAQLTTVIEVDVTKIARLRAQAKNDFEAREGVKLSFLPFFAVATIEALKTHPSVNASVDMEAKTVTYHDAEHLGIAVDTDRGLLVPVIHNAGDLNLAGIARKIADLAARTRDNKVSPDELGGGTFTLTNTGSRGALFDTPIINQPQVGILGTGAVVKRAVVISDEELGETIAVRSMVYLALSYDHRIVDGADAARFLVTIKARLEAGAFERALGLAS
jgi:pyruvate dehydrogenase E2 component (dihydrolipoamide acetyltransferase)